MSVQLSSPLSLFLTTGEIGQSFYTDKTDRNVTAISNYYKVKVKTSRLVIVDAEFLTCEKITKVTLI